MPQPRRTKQILSSEGNQRIDESLERIEDVLNFMEEELMNEEPSLIKLANLHGKLTGFYREIIYFRNKFEDKRHKANTSRRG